MALNLSDDLLAAIERAAAPIRPTERPAFIQTVAAALQAYPVLGEGVVHRTVASLQSRYTVEGRFESNPGGGIGRRPTHRGAQKARGAP
jgi:hypothetical protein